MTRQPRSNVGALDRGWLLLVSLLSACGSRSTLEAGEQPVPPACPCGVCAGSPGWQPDDHDAGSMTRLAVIGDYGLAGPAEQAVASLIEAYGPDAVITTGDNNYLYGEAATIDANIGQYFANFIRPYRGAYGAGASENRFFPSLGNHDWYTAGAEPYLDYFALPGNERYYDLVWGHAHLFAVDSDTSEPDGIASDSTQACWLAAQLAASRARWKIVYLHEAPYGSGALHGSNPTLRWPYREWGADLVLNGHNHVYERVEVDGLAYITNGLGGGPIHPFGMPVEGSLVRYNQGHGAGFVEVDAHRMRVSFVAVDGTLVDELVLARP